MKQKKLLLLGGLNYLIPVIKSAHKLGYYVITCDYIPDNIAHKYSDEYHNVSILDKDKILALAKQLNIDGIMSFAVDPGVLTAAYVAEQLGLPGVPYESAKILQNKKLFRQFLAENGFNVPRAKGYNNIEEALQDVDLFDWPIIVKPTDSAGSKGVSKVVNKECLTEAIKFAMSNSFTNEFIIEEFIEQKGYSSDSDCFSIDNDLFVVSFSNQYFDKNVANPYTPAAYSWPSSISSDKQEELTSELKRLVKLLNLGTSIYNIEVREGLNGKAYIMEVSPRGGGNRLSEMIRFSTGFDIIDYAVKASMGEPLDKTKSLSYHGYWAEIILHTNKEGLFDKLEIDETIHDKIIETDLWILKGHKISNFRAANDAIGTLVFRFDHKSDMENFMHNYNKLISIVLEDNG